MFKRFFVKIFTIIFGVFTATTPVHYVDNNATSSPQIKTDTKTEISTSTKQVVKKGSVATTTVPQKKPTAPGQNLVTATTTVEIKPPEPAPDFESINTFSRTAVVNIICTVNGDSLSPISGTGVVVDPSGIILTNAHIGQYFLLRDLYQKDFINCVIRTGSPAYPRYHAELVYISPKWVEANKAELKNSNPQGTGENDFAFLRITDRTDGSPIEVNFPYIKPNTDEIAATGTPVILVSYPAGFLGAQSILRDLSITSAITTIQDLFTFKAVTVDAIDVGGTVLSQKGASGGAVVDGHSRLIGIIATVSSGSTTSSRELNAITASYINRSLQQDIHHTLPDFLSQDLVRFARTFQTDTAPGLSKLIKDELTKN